MCACEDTRRDRCTREFKPHCIMRDLSVSRFADMPPCLGKYLSMCLSPSTLGDLQHPAESYFHTMPCLDSYGFRLLSFTDPVAKKVRDDSLDHHDHESPFPMLSSTTEVSELSTPFLSLALALPVIDTMALSSLQPETQTAGTNETQERALAGAEEGFIAGRPLTTFHAFGNLPPELRIKIWRLTFLPRVLELHPTRLNDAAAVGDDHLQQQQQWQSGCSNPAALSVCSEAREIALEHFRIACPLASIISQQDNQIGAITVTGTKFNGKAGLRRRVLYISPEYDTVALLDQDTNSTKLSNLLNRFRDADRKRRGMSSLALSTSGQVNDESVPTSYDTTVLRDLNQLILFPNSELWPPSDWSARGAGIDEQSLDSFRETGNKCELVPCRTSNAWYVYKQWRGGKGRQFWDNQKRTLEVGKNRVRIQDLEFSKGW